MLYEPQKEFCNNAQNYFKRYDISYLILPVGSGKTHITLMLNHLMKNKITLFLGNSLVILKMWIHNLRYFTDINTKYVLIKKENVDQLENIINNKENKNLIIFAHTKYYKNINEHLNNSDSIIDFLILDEYHRIKNCDQLLNGKRILKKLLINNIFYNILNDDSHDKKMVHLYYNENENIMKKKLYLTNKFTNISIIH